MRLQRFLARAGVASRRGSEDLMTAGRVRVNGEVASELGTKVDPARDEVTVDGRAVRLADGAVHLMLHKPAGYLTTMRDPQGRPCVASLVPTERHPGLFPVGRLDRDTTGLLLFTTDGDLAQNLLHPSKHVWKTYLAVVDGLMADRELDPLRRGIELDDGPCQPARCRIVGTRPEQGATEVEVVIREGRKNQVKRMLSRVRHPVIALHRSRFGPLELSDLPEGSWRPLTASEIDALTHPKGTD
ncbi:MAG: rRNA pseudouridine synthase [Coriobacteriaceae bacterium]|nr:rRNA pseudouridine synthase [Coriobacteriaceae bacterium]